MSGHVVVRFRENKCGNTTRWVGYVMLSDFASMRACVISKHQPRGASQRSIPGESEKTCLKGEPSKEAALCNLC